MAFLPLNPFHSPLPCLPALLLIMCPELVVHSHTKISHAKCATKTSKGDGDTVTSKALRILVLPFEKNWTICMSE